ncbi:MAG: HEPN domain-containing protein [Bacteroidota bacterium]
MGARTSIIIEEAEKTYADAVFLLESGRYDSAVNRAYYTAFHCAQALLQNEGIFAKTHAGTRSKFAEIFIKTNLLSSNLNEWFKKLATSRTAADYTYDYTISSEIAEKAVRNAAYFLAETKSYFRNLEEKTDEPNKE